MKRLSLAFSALAAALLVGAGASRYSLRADVVNPSQATPYSGTVVTGTISAACSNPCDTPETANSVVKISTAGVSSVNIMVTASDASGTFQCESSADGFKWDPVNCLNADLTALTRGAAFTNPVARTVYHPNLFANGWFRIRASALASGSATFQLRSGSIDAYNVMIPVSAWPTVQIPQRGVMIAGTDGTTACNSTGCLQLPIVKSSAGAGTENGLFVRPVGAQVAPWSCGLTAIGATLTECKAAPAAGLRAYVDDITIGSDTATAGNFTLRYGTGTNCGTGTTTLFPAVASITTGKWLYPANTAAPTSYSFTAPLVPGAANAICVICIATQTCTVSIQGHLGS